MKMSKMTRMPLLAFITLVLSYSNVFSQDQDTCHLFIVIGQEKKYYDNEILPNAKENYVSIINLAKWIRPKLIAEINRLYPLNSICSSSKYSILEAYDIAHADLFGLIWVDSIFYSYREPPSRRVGSKLSVEQKTFSSLSEEEKAIVSNFDNWNCDIFRSQINSPRHVNPPMYYLATKAMFSTIPEIKTIAFCY